MITERMMKEIRRGEVIKTRKYVYWAECRGACYVVLRADRDLEGTLEYKESIVIVDRFR